jgi:hypothetical protein
VNPAVAKVFATYPPKLRQRLLAVRRMIFFDAGERVPAAELKICIGMALTYHRKRARE